MAGRQNLSARKVGNDRDAERAALLNKKVSREDRQAAIDAHEAQGREETRRRAAETNESSRNARTSAPRPDHQTSGTDDLTARGAGQRISGRQHQIDTSVDEMAGKKKDD